MRRRGDGVGVAVGLNEAFCLGVLSDTVAGYSVIEAVAMACVGRQRGLRGADELFDLVRLVLFIRKIAEYKV
ncbi:MAG: hypothetical protein CO182_00530 [Lysobacterales bacterium CG_4_9_14_3_um_filter_62_6]|nr:MAG: hypothetical protein CO182_00530 [Xanthomonadales bacterium CG_4_9_14_3_um_filter_62_6]